MGEDNFESSEAIPQTEIEYYEYIKRERGSDIDSRVLKLKNAFDWDEIGVSNELDYFRVLAWAGKIFGENTNVENAITTELVKQRVETSINEYALPFQKTLVQTLIDGLYSLKSIDGSLNDNQMMRLMNLEEINRNYQQNNMNVEIDESPVEHIDVSESKAFGVSNPEDLQFLKDLTVGKSHFYFEILGTNKISVLDDMLDDYEARRKSLEKFGGTLSNDEAETLARLKQIRDSKR